MATIANWIWLQNVRAFVDVLARLSGYELSEGEWDAIDSGVAVSDSDANPPRWYSYSFEGKSKVKFDVGHDKGTNVVQIRLTAPDEIVPRIQTALELMNSYVLTKDS